MPASSENALGRFLKERRARLDPSAFGFGTTRRRTPGLRREEVAQRADVSATWYTWLEQGRDGTPSADVLERIARALQLSDAEREHMFLIAQHRPPGLRGQSSGSVTPRLQRVIDAMESSPAIVKTPDWSIVAWNTAAARVLTDYGALPPEQRNILRLLFCDRSIRDRNPHWESQARLVVATFRLQNARTGGSDVADALVQELSAISPEFKAMWADNDVHTYGDGVKHIDHPTAGPIALEYASFAVDGQPDLELLIYTPATRIDMDLVRSLISN
jgi:transcriptional regulator with XRE-family HTH domain